MAQRRIDPAGFPVQTRRMAKKSEAKAAATVREASSLSPKSKPDEIGRMPEPRSSSLLDTSVIYCCDDIVTFRQFSFIQW
jgi:hypothetical protein